MKLQKSSLHSGRNWKSERKQRKVKNEPTGSVRLVAQWNRFLAVRLRMQDLPKLIGFLKRQETNGKFFSKAMQKEPLTDMELSVMAEGVVFPFPSLPLNEGRTYGQPEVVLISLPQVATGLRLRLPGSFRRRGFQPDLLMPQGALLRKRAFRQLHSCQTRRRCCRKSMPDTAERGNYIMAIFHFTVKIVGRSKGKSVISASAYLNGDVMKNEETGRISYYTSKKEVVYTSLMMCENAPPEWLHVPEENIKRFQQSIRYKRADDKDAALEKFKITFQKQRLWNEVLKIEKNADAQLGRSFEFSLPKEWSRQEQIDYTPNISKRLSWIRECVSTGAYTIRAMETHMCIYL